MSAEGIKRSHQLVTTFQDSSVKTCWLQGAWPELNYWQELHCQIFIEPTTTSSQRLIN